MAGGKPPGSTGIGVKNYSFDQGTLALLQSSAPGICLAIPPHIDELTPSAQYMALEMNNNSKSNAVASVLAAIGIRTKPFIP